MSRGDQVVVRYVRESTFGVTPTNSANWKRARITGEDLSTEVQTEESEELAGTERGTRDLILTGHSAGGGVQFELSPTSFDDLIEAFLGGTWTTDVLKPGNVQRSFTFEKEFNDLGKYIAYKGMAPNKLELKFATKTKVTGSLSFIGAQCAPSASSLVGTGTTAALSTTGVYRTGSSITGLKVNGTAASAQGIRFKSITLSLEQGQTPDDTLDSDYPTGMVAGDLKIGLAAEIYFDDITVVGWMLNGTPFSLEWQVNLAGYSFKVELPKVVLTGGAPGGASRGGALMQSLAGTAVIDPVKGYSIAITRDNTP